MKQVFLLFIALTGIGMMQSVPVNAQPARLSEDARISLITILPGDAAEELFGHSALRVTDEQQNLDLLFNYGTFEFDAFFLPRFVYGELDYFLSVVHTGNAIRYYRERRRPLVEQVLNLSAEQTRSLYDFLLVNAREENRYYRYDFLYDNCSTRIRDALESVLGNDLHFEPEPDPGLTFRELINIYVENKPLPDFGINLLLGKKIDIVADSREVMFLPDYLKSAFDHASVQHSEEVYPLVGSQNILLQIENYDTPRGLPWADITAWGLLIFGGIITIRSSKKNKAFYTWFDSTLFFATGLFGLLITFLWFVSLHNVTASNLNLVWAWPTNLLLLPFLFSRKKSRQWTNFYFFIYSLCCMVFVLGWFLWEQQLHSAFFPILLLLSLRSGWISLSK